ncbi:MAG: hypothetical protein WDZ62_01180 [Candidatus Pacearchaeota archaeon]
MVKKFSKKETLKEIDGFFNNIKNKTPKEVKKIKKLAMSFNIKLKDKKKKFCKKCLEPYSGLEKVRLNKGIKSITCKNCNYISRWKIKTS